MVKTKKPGTKKELNNAFILMMGGIIMMFMFIALIIDVIIGNEIMQMKAMVIEQGQMVEEIYTKDINAGQPSAYNKLR